MAQNNSLLNMATANPASTDVHNNINNLIMKAEMDSKLRQYSMSAYKTPQPITGTIPDVALSPLLTLRSLGSVGKKLLERTGLKNPISHYTSTNAISKILKEGRIKGSSDSFPGKPFYGDRKNVLSKKNKQFENESLASTDEIQFYKDNMPSRSPSVSVTRDPAFLQRAHSHVGTDVKFIMDRDDLIKSGLKINPFAESGFRKSLTTDADFPLVRKIDPTTQSVRNPEYYKKIYGRYPEQMNPRFEFEERVRGNIPLNQVKLIDFLNLPSGAGSRFSSAAIMDNLIKSKIPIIRNPQTTEQILRVQKMLNKYGYPDYLKAKAYSLPSKESTEKNISKLLETLTYKQNPFK